MKTKWNEKRIKELPIKEKRYKVNLGVNFYLEITPSGQKFYRVKKSNQTKTIGNSHDISFKKAQSLVPQAINELLNPLAKEKTYGEIFDIWSEDKSWVLSTRNKRLSIVKLYLHVFNKRKISEIHRLEILEVLRAIEKEGKFETASKALGIIRQVYDYAIICGYVEFNPTTGLSKAIKRQENQRRSALLKESEIVKLVTSIQTCKSLVVKNLFLFNMYTLCRPSECRRAEWSEFDNGIWKIPASRMKLRKEHTVPLPRQCLEILERMKQIKVSHFVFPSTLPGRSLGDNTLLVALRKMGFAKEEMTIHGLRAMGSTILNEKGYRHDVIEKALAHAGEDKIRAIYNRAEYLEERRQMLQDYADYLDSLVIHQE